MTIPLLPHYLADRTVEAFCHSALLTWTFGHTAGLSFDAAWLINISTFESEIHTCTLLSAS